MFYHGRSMHSGSDAYRPDIDGLRSVAVLSVIAFHAFPQWLPAGFAGVDVFFVISGYLISSQLMAAAETGALSFSAFYARRIRRIFPALIVVLLATLTYLFIERPIRRDIKARSLSEVIPIAGAMAALGIVMAAALTTGWLTPPARTALEIDTQVPMALNESLCRGRFQELGEYCQQFDAELPVRMALLGDSHAAHLFPGLGAVAKAAGVNVVHLGQTGCPPSIGIERLQVIGDNNCVRVNRAMIESVASDAAITDVWLSFRGALATTGREPGESTERIVFRSLERGATNVDAIRDGLQKTIALLQSRGKKVGVFLQIPELGFPVDQCTGRPVSLRYRPVREPCSVDRAAVMTRQTPYRELVAVAQAQSGIAVFDPLAALCDETVCHAVADGHMLYFDDNHLGAYGSTLLLRQFVIRPGQ